MSHTPSSLLSEDEIVEKKILRLNAILLGLALGTILGLLVFISTNWLVIKGGETVGPHLSLISQYFWGYSVTFMGSLIGLGWGLVVGFLAGAAIAWIYNLAVQYVHRPKG